ncbi:MAG: hypothetical protein A2V67_07315 [Deltaproteobacteria bacterium RBG_13_61_14]|nr:MAG: hypothetical protein A2V67_07315 [Deltaproteobacteria bacterium RBG_13_61_14]
MPCKIATALLAAAVLGWAFSLPAKEKPAEPGAEKVSKPFEYRGYTSEEFKGVQKFSEYVTMDDGVKLAVDIYLPADGPAQTAFPVIMEYTPYTRAFIDLKNGPIHKLGRKAALKTSSPVIDLLAVPSMTKPIRVFLAHGYAIVRADMRGSGASFGWKADFMPQLAEDGGELVAWIAKQPWCDGNVGMIGGSYTGYSQLVTAGKAGPALKCIAPMMVPLEGYDGEVYPGGIYLHGFMAEYSEGLTKLNLNYYQLNFGKLLLGQRDFSLPAAPVMDEDGDGRLDDEIPLDLNHNGSFLDDYNYPADPTDEPKYKDGQKRRHIYYLANADHKRNLDYHAWAQNMFFLDAVPPYPLQDVAIYDFDPSAHLPAIMKSGIAVYNVGGWFDTFPRGTTELYATMKDTNPSKMLIVPGYHGGGGPFWKYLGEDPKSVLKKGAPELLRFFDHYLKGIDNGVEKDPPIQIYVMNAGGFRAESEWPLARQVITDYYFNSDHGLSTQASTPGADKYKADFTHDARFGKKQGNRWLAAMGQAPDQLPVRTRKDKQCLTYTSAPLLAEMEVTGHPIVRFWVSSTADDGDFFVYLEDVDEKGKALLITEGVLRAGFAPLVSNDKEIWSGRSGVDVKPELPWHGFEKANYNPAIFAHGNIVELVFDLKPTSWVFKPGHSLRVTIAAADWPTFRLHERLAPDNDPRNPANIVPIITVHRDAEHPSRIQLPVIPKGSGL